MKTRKAARTITEELIANAIGWVAGLLSVDLLSLFFTERKLTNAWGLFSRKTAVSAETFSFLEWIVTAVVGFAVLFVVNRYVGNWLLSKIDKDDDELKKVAPTRGEEV